MLFPEGLQQNITEPEETKKYSVNAAVVQSAFAIFNYDARVKKTTTNHMISNTEKNSRIFLFLFFTLSCADVKCRLGRRVNDGLWHSVSVTSRDLQLALTLDGEQSSNIELWEQVESKGSFHFGGRRLLAPHASVRMFSVTREKNKTSLLACRPPRLPSHGVSGPGAGVSGVHAAHFHQQPASESQSRAARLAGKL